MNLTLKCLEEEKSMERVFAAVVKGKVVINRSQFHKRVIVATTSLKECLLFSQYSEKEDKYEEEIKILSDKLKEGFFSNL